MPAILSLPPGRQGQERNPRCARTALIVAVGPWTLPPNHRRASLVPVKHPRTVKEDAGRQAARSVWAAARNRSAFSQGQAERLRITTTMWWRGSGGGLTSEPGHTEVGLRRLLVRRMRMDKEGQFQ
jgi:hypothetical protein